MSRFKLLFCLCLLASRLWATIGEANHNPGNIRSVHWKQWGGAIGIDPYLHIKFISDEAGFSAIKRILLAYSRKHHIHTCRGVAYRWIGKKHTQKQKDDYCAVLCQYTGLEPDSDFIMDTPWTLQHLAHGIVREEIGSDPYPDWLYRKVFN